MPRRVSTCSSALVVALLWLDAWAHAQVIAELHADRVIEVAAEPGREVASVLTAAAISPDGRLMATGGDDHVVRLWETGTGKLVAQSRAHTDWVRAVVFHPAGDTLASAGDDNAVRIVNLTAEPVYTFADSRHPVLCLAYRADGTMLAAAGFDEQLRLYDPRMGKLLHTLECPSNDMHAVAFSPDGSKLAAGGRNGQVRIWNLVDYRVAYNLAAHRQRVRALTFSPDSSYLATGGDDRQIRIWDTTSGNEIAALPTRTGKVQCLAFCSARLLASGGSDNVIRVVDLSAPERHHRLIGHTGSVSALGFHAGTGTLVSASFDTTARLWQPLPTTQRGSADTAAKTPP